MDLDSLYSQLQSLKDQLQDKLCERQHYLDLAAEVYAVYQRLAADKATVKDYRNQIKGFEREKFENFSGMQYAKVYSPKMRALFDSYTTLVNRIDANMDALNTLRADYENRAYQCDGPIGYLRGMINSVVHTIQNWTN